MDARERIIEGAAESFSAYGVKAVTMDSIARSVGVSKRTIYEIFSDKEELLRNVFDNIAMKQKQLVDKILKESDNAIEAFFRLLEVGRDQLQRHSPAFLTDIQKYHRKINGDKKCKLPDFNDSARIIEKGIKQKLFREDSNPVVVSICLYVLGKSIMDNEIFPYEQFTKKELVKGVIINYLRGISTQEGVELINKKEENF